MAPAPGSRSAGASLLWLFVLLGAAGCESTPRFSQAMVLGGKTISAEVLDRGAWVYETRCASCHGADGSGNGAAGRALQNPPRDFRAASFRYKSTEGDALPTDADLDATIRHGRIEQGMPAWGSLSDDDIHAVIQFLKTFSPRWQEQGT